MSTSPDAPKVSSGEATITYSGEVKQATGKLQAKLVAKRHIAHVFHIEHGDIGFIDIVVSELEPYREESIGASGRYPFKAEFTLDEGPASYVFEDESVYVIDRMSQETPEVE